MTVEVQNPIAAARAKMSSMLLASAAEIVVLAAMPHTQSTLARLRTKCFVAAGQAEALEAVVTPPQQTPISLF